MRLGGHKTDVYGREFKFGHICGTYDNTEAGVWELFVSDEGIGSGGVAPGVTFASADHVWRGLGLGSRPGGRLVPLAEATIPHGDAGWHHVAWQWRAADQAHFLHVDGGLVWTARPPVLCDPPVLCSRRR